MPYQPLNGIRILDLSRLLPGPYVTQLFADLGAEIIKVERPGAGDYARDFTAEMGLAGMFDAINRGKKSLGLDYRSPRGRELFLALCQTADVVLESFRPGAVKNWGIGFDDVRAVKENIVYCSLSGYGQTGPYCDRAGHDINYTALGGALMLNAPPGGIPMPYSIPLSDLGGSILAGFAILAALTGRDPAHRGCYIDVSLLDGMIALVTPLIGGSYFHGQKTGAQTAPITTGKPYYAVYQTSDGRFISFAPIEAHFWDRFCKRIERPDLSGRQFDPAIGEELKLLFLQKTRAAWMSLLADLDACIESVNTFEDMLFDPHVQARGHVRMEDGRPVRMNSPFVFARVEGSDPPRLGNDTREILSALGLAEDELARLSEQGVISL
ncbi:MAG TPA: CaiB/BaiF CoA-transferase family protein [Anaerolineales bacterium]|nr:CaiB/BaiF CoA-transferase family protein [Anaerolineales bacterium]